MKRTFIALPVPPADDRLLQLLSDARRSLPGSGPRWVGAENLHLTLAFTGDTSQECLHTIPVLLQELAATHPVFQFTLAGVGVFGKSGNPAVLWAGILPCSGLMSLQASVVKMLHLRGIQFDKQQFSPHLTIARIKQGTDALQLQQFLERYRELELQDTEVREMVFYESLLTPAGPIYKPLDRFPLTGLTHPAREGQ